MVFQSGCDRCRTAVACTGWLPNSLASSSSSPKPSGNGQPIPAATARSRYSWTVPSPIPQLRAIWRCPNPNSNFNRRTSLTLRMDILLAGTLSSLIDGVSMPGDCPASLHLLLLVCGKHSAPSRTPFRQATNTVRLPTGIGVHLQTGMLFGITTESCSASERNRVHLRPDSPVMHSLKPKGQATRPGTAFSGVSKSGLYLARLVWILGIRDKTYTLTLVSSASATNFHARLVSFNLIFRFLLTSQQITIGIWAGLWP